MAELTCERTCPPGACPPTGDWDDLLADRLTAERHAALLVHLVDCPDCQRVLSTCAADPDAWAQAARHLNEGLLTDEFLLKRALASLREPPSSPVTPEPAPETEWLVSLLDPPDTPGHLGRLGPYEVLEVIGRGGMGVVLKAYDSKLRRIVAIKVPAPVVACRADARERFVREARAAAVVQNDYVLHLYYVQDEGQLPYLVMEYVTGGSLQERLDGGPLPVEEVIRIGLEAATGLAGAHARGLTHRDVKPGNILLDGETGRVKLSDFGLARAADDA